MYIGHTVFMYVCVAFTGIGTNSLWTTAGTRAVYQADQ